jgi:hypothetical protein
MCKERKKNYLYNKHSKFHFYVDINSLDFIVQLYDKSTQIAGKVSKKQKTTEAKSSGSNRIYKTGITGLPGSPLVLA